MTEKTVGINTSYLLPEQWLKEVIVSAEKLALYWSKTGELSEPDIMAHLVERDTAQLLDALSLITIALGQYMQNETLLTTAKTLTKLSARLYTQHFNRATAALSTQSGTE